MLKKLLILSLIVIPFYEVFLYFLIPGRNFPFFPDMRVTKDFMAMGFSMGIGSVVLFKYGFGKVKNVWIPIFLTFLVFNMAKAPGSFVVNQVEMAGLWNYKSAYQLFAYFFLFLGVSNLPDLPIKSIFKTIAYCGLGMAVLMLLQRAGLDQIFRLMPVEIRLATKLPEMGGTLGAVTLSAPFIVMCLPFMAYLKNWLWCVVMIAAVVMSGSSFAMAGLGAVMVAIVILSAKRKVIAGFIGAGIVVLIVGLYVRYNPDFLNSNGRVSVWRGLLLNLKEGKIAFTGAGIGAFKYLYAVKHWNKWYHAHNEYLQLLWSCGIIGFGICFMAVKAFLCELWRNLTRENKVILASFVGIGVVSCGTFPLQLAAYQYYLIVMAGVIYNNGGNNGQINI